MTSLKVKIAILTLLVLAISARPANATPPAYGQPGEFLRYGVGARPLSMGGAFVGLADDINSVYYNPAGITALRGIEISLMCTRFWPGVSYQYFAIGHPDVLPETWPDRFAVAIAHVRHDMESFEYRTATDMYLGHFNITEHATFLSAAWAPWEWLSAGTTLKWVFQNWTIYDRQGRMGADFGLKMRYDLYEKGMLVPLQLGVCVQNLVWPEFETETLEENLPTQLDIGISGQFIKEKSTFILATDWYRVIPRKGDLYRGRNGMNLGIEYTNRVSPKTEISLRLGYRGSSESVTVGVGVKIDLGYLVSGLNIGGRSSHFFTDKGVDLPDYVEYETTIRPSACRRDAEYYMVQGRNAIDSATNNKDDAHRTNNERYIKRCLSRIIDMYPNDYVTDAVVALTVYYDRSSKHEYSRLIRK